MRLLVNLKNKFSALSLTKKTLVSSLFLAMLAFSVWAGWQFGYKKFVNKDIKSPLATVISGKPQEPVDFPNPITGVLFKKSQAQTWVNQLPLAVMVENHTDARPQTGLSKADIVYEALAEGGITRFLAVYLQEDSEIGPVRSARPYYIDWASEYDAAYVHFGGSPGALDKIQSLGIKDLNGIYIGDPVFVRSNQRPAPHNVYTTTQKLRTEASQKGYSKGSDIVPWKFLDAKDVPARKDRPASYDIKLGFDGTYGYEVEWRYNQDTNSYLRFNAGIAALDSGNANKQLEVSTIIVQTIKDSPDPSGHARLDLATIGSDRVTVFLNGKAVTGTWRKESRTGRTQFFDDAGNEIKLNRGKIWVEMIPPGSAFTHSQ